MKRSTTLLILATLCCLGFAAAGFAAEIDLSSSLYPEKTTVDVPFVETAIGPKTATAEATIKYKEGQAQIEISYKGMQPAVMFAGNITCYSVFAVTKDGVAENLGELRVAEANGSGKFSTGQKAFGLIITAEPISGVKVPSTLVVLKSGPAKQPEAKSASFKFSQFGNAYYQNLVKPGNPSVADLPPFKEFKEPIELIKARKLVEMAEGMKLAPEMTKNLADAKQALAQATNLATGGGGTRAVTDYAARAESLAAEAVRMTVRKEYEKKLSDEEARKAAEKAALKTDLALTTAEKDQLAVDKRQLEADKSQLLTDKAALQTERDALAARLNGAVERIMEVRQTARGLALDLGNVLFDVNKATLKQGAFAPLSKLSGILLMVPDVNVRIEGFSDSTGSAERNKVLSAERARSVFDYLVSQKIDASRLSHAGYGPANPVADNATAEGRTRNRRVELTLAQGTIEPTPGGFTAPEVAPATTKAPAKEEAKPAAKPAEPVK